MLGEAQNPSVATPAASSDLRMCFSLGRRADGALFGRDVTSLSSYADRFNRPACLVGVIAVVRTAAMRLFVHAPKRAVRAGERHLERDGITFDAMGTGQQDFVPAEARPDQDLDLPAVQSLPSKTRINTITRTRPRPPPP